MNIPAPGGGVAGTTASLAVPPDGSAAPASTPAPYDWHNPVDESSFTPWQTYLANELRNGRLGAETLKNAAVPLGQTAIGGPGSDWNTQTEIAKARNMPYDTTTGTSRHFPGVDQDAPEKVVSGGDPIVAAAEQKQRELDIADADRRAGLAETASQQLNENQRLLNIYNRLVNTPGTPDTASIIGDSAFQNLAKIPGLENATKLSTRLGAIQAIQARLGTSINNQLNASTGPGDTVPRGLLQRIQPPNPDSDPESFRAAMEQYNRALQYQQDEGPTANTFRSSMKDKSSADAYRAALEAHARSVYEKERAEAAGGGGGGGGGGVGGETYVFPDANSANAAVNSGQVPHGSKIKVGGKIIGVVGD